MGAILKSLGLKSIAASACASAALACAAVAGGAMTGAAESASAERHAASATTDARPTPALAGPKPKLDLSGRKRVGVASFYAGRFSGRKMADGTRMNPRTDNAASKTLPLGTTAKVTNLETGQSAVVTIQDRGPYVQGRIVDLSPSTAEKVGIGRHEGVAKVEVAPIVVPIPDGRTKAGEAAQDAHSESRRPDSPSR